MTEKTKTQRDMLQELHQTVLGIPDNPLETGLVGDVHEIRNLLRTQNGRIDKCETTISKIKGIAIAVVAIAGAGGTGVGIEKLIELLNG